MMQDAIAKAISTGSPLVALMRLQAEVSAHVEPLLAFLDATNGDEDRDGGDINDEPQDEDFDSEPSLGWTEDVQHGKQSFNVDAELAAELTNAERQAAHDRKKAGVTGIANTKIDPHWYGPVVRLPSGEVIR